MSEPAFPGQPCDIEGMPCDEFASGLTKREWFAGQALANPIICTGTAPEWQLQAWFGNRMGISAAEIAAKQAVTYADAMLAESERTKPC